MCVEVGGVGAEGEESEVLDLDGTGGKIFLRNKIWTLVLFCTFEIKIM